MRRFGATGVLSRRPGDVLGNIPTNHPPCQVDPRFNDSLCHSLGWVWDVKTKCGDTMQKSLCMFFHGHMVMIFGTSKKTSHKSESGVGRFDSLAALANECGLSSSGSN